LGELLVGFVGHNMSTVYDSLTNMADLFDDRPYIKDKMFELPFNLRVMLCWTTMHIIRIACVAFLWYHVYFDIIYIRLKAQVIPVSFLTTTPSRPVKSYWGVCCKRSYLVFTLSLFVFPLHLIQVKFDCAQWSFEQRTWRLVHPQCKIDVYLLSLEGSLQFDCVWNQTYINQVLATYCNSW
jgi:hypothetical protein